MPKIDFKHDGIGHFLSDKFFKIPIYQRSFAWHKENVIELFDDITNSYPNKYFIGTIVVTDKGDYLEIVDGQQRLVTVSLFFIAVRDFLNEIGETKKADVEGGSRGSAKVSSKIDFSKMSDDQLRQVYSDPKLKKKYFIY